METEKILYIRRDKVLDHIQELQRDLYLTPEENEMCHVFKDIVETLPTKVGAEEVKADKWSKFKDEYMCELCGYSFIADDCEEMNFCPSCGKPKCGVKRIGMKENDIMNKEIEMVDYDDLEFQLMLAVKCVHNLSEKLGRCICIDSVYFDYSLNREDWKTTTSVRVSNRSGELFIAGVDRPKRFTVSIEPNVMKSKKGWFKDMIDKNDLYDSERIAEVKVYGRPEEGIQEESKNQRGDQEASEESE